MYITQPCFNFAKWNIQNLKKNMQASFYIKIGTQNIIPFVDKQNYPTYWKRIRKEKEKKLKITEKRGKSIIFSVCHTIHYISQ